MSGIGHNGGPSMAAGHGFRKLSWQKARTQLLPTLPLEVVRLRVARAKRLGLPYKTYATIRATSGRDIVAFLFSGNALDLRPRQVVLPQAVAGRLADLPAKRLAAVYAPAAPEEVLAQNPFCLDHSDRAPELTASWRQMRDGVLALKQQLPSDGVVLVSATRIETEWAAAGGLGGRISADAFFRP